MLDIRAIAPNLSEGAIAAYESRGRFEWILLSRIYEQGLFGGKELNEHDLCQSVPQHRIGDLKLAIRPLLSQGVLQEVPKPSEPVYRGNRSHPVFNDDPSKEIMVEIRRNRAFKKAIIEGQMEIRRIHPQIVKLLEYHLEKAMKKNPRTLDSYKINCHTKKVTVLEGDFYAAMVTYNFVCPNTHRIIEIQLVVDSPNLFATLESVNCPHCKLTHYARRSGMIE
jgi:hypothetical protein